MSRGYVRGLIVSPPPSFRSERRVATLSEVSNRRPNNSIMRSARTLNGKDSRIRTIELSRSSLEFRKEQNKVAICLCI